MYSARYKNGNAIPSLLPDSADNKFRKCPGTRLANFPFPTTDDARTGSVAVTHAPTHNASTYYQYNPRKTVVVYKSEGRDKPVYKSGADEPTKRHDGDQQKKQTFPMSIHVCFG